MVLYVVKYMSTSGRRHETGKLGAWFSADDFLEKWGNDPVVSSPAKDMHAYLSRAGSFVDRENIYKGDHYAGLNVYHYGNATVALKYCFHVDIARKDVAGDISVNILSSGAVDDVMRKLSKRFSFLKENASIDDIPDHAFHREE